jgi:ABC-type polysaccharide transport system, permease component
MLKCIGGVNLAAQTNIQPHITKSRFSINSDKLTLALMAFPPLVLLIVFAYGPVFGWVYAFFNYKIGMPLSQCDFVGLKYFKLAFAEPDMYRVLVNTLAMSFLGLLGIPIAAGFAILLSELRFARYKKIIQTTTTLPNFISWIIVYSIVFTFFAPGDGVVNRFLMGHNLLSAPLDPLGNGDTVWISQTLINFWKNMGYSAIIFFAAIAGLDNELFDAAKVDGAGRFRRIVHIMIPGLIPTVITLLLLGVGSLLSGGFDQYFVFYNPMVANKIEVLDYYVYRIGLQNNDIPFAAAISVSKTIVATVMVFSANGLAKKLRGQSII